MDSLPFCTCAAWQECIKTIDSLYMLGWTHGIVVQERPWQFCPWCGARLIDPTASQPDPA